MKGLVLRIWNDEAFFQRVVAAGFFGAGICFAAGIIPTFIAGGGDKIGDVCKAIALFIAAGGTIPGASK